jgi:hypothetical protein
LFVTIPIAIQKPTPPRRLGAFIDCRQPVEMLASNQLNHLYRQMSLLIPI